MIIETPYKVGDVVSIKLSSGEEMIAKLEEETATHISVNKPLILVAAETGIGLSPFMFTVSPDAKVRVNINSIICIVKSAKDADNTYIQQTTGLHLAKA
jgi:hypothetical protein